jgi:hypothetical protein
MSLEDLGNIGEFVAAVGVIASLIYLALQIRQNTMQITQNTKTVRSATFRGATQLFTQFMARLSENPELASIVFKANQSPSDLTPEHRLRFDSYAMEVFTIYEDLFFQAQDEMLDLKFWNSRQRNLVWYLDFPGFAAAWKRQSHTMSPEFRDFVATLRSHATE